MIEPKSILHFTIGVTDLDRATEFYRDIVGCKLLRQNRRHTMSFMEAGGDYFVLTSTGLHTPPNGPKGTQFHHAFVVAPEAYDDAVAHLKANGIELLWPQAKADGPDTQHNTFPGRHVYFHDPDGNGLEITDCDGLGD
jgi:catechol 2,3-dioxygenase-like lactoylglutathione lyase family enzyme